MNSLLKHQVKKYLSSENVSNEDLLVLIDAVGRSYDNFDEQRLLLQRALIVSSEEMSIAITRLKQESFVQSNLIDKLNKIIESIKLHELPEGKKVDALNLDGVKLAEFIDKQTQEIVQMNEQRDNLMKQLESQNQELSDYAYLVSHDLKSPLRSIDALTAWLNQDEQDQKPGNTSENLKLIRSNVEKMDNLISGILNYSTINKNQSEIYDIDVNVILKEVLGSLTIPKSIHVNAPGNFPVVKGDKYRMTQLFGNLIDNAIKSIDKTKGFVEIGFSEELNFWQFYVKDNGMGIEKTYFDKIFSPFQKLEQNPTATGIGLSMAKKIVNAYNGKIWLESEIGKGTIFYFTIKK